MIVTKKVGGDSYAEIERSPETFDILNIKPLNPARVSHITNKKGILIKYEYDQGNGEEKIRFSPSKILHFCNDRVIDEPHGTSVTASIKWVVTAMKEAIEAFRRTIRLSNIRILYVDENDKNRLAELKAEYKDGLEKGYVMILPVKPEDAKFEDLTTPPTEAYLRYLQYLEDQFYKQIGVPKVVLGGTAENTEASAKVGVISYEPTWTREIKEIEKDIKSQLGIELKINKQPSLMENMQADEAKNSGQAKLKFQGNQ